MFEESVDFISNKTVTSAVVVGVVAVTFCLVGMAGVNKGMPVRPLEVSPERVLNGVPETLVKNNVAAR